MMAFMGTAVACALLTGYAVLHWSETGAGYLLTWAWIIKKVEEGQSGHVLYSSSEGTSPPELVIDITGGVLDSDGDGVLDTVFWPCGRALIIALKLCSALTITALPSIVSVSGSSNCPMKVV